MMETEWVSAMLVPTAPSSSMELRDRVKVKVPGPVAEKRHRTDAVKEIDSTGVGDVTLAQKLTIVFVLAGGDDKPVIPGVAIHRNRNLWEPSI